MEPFITLKSCQGFLRGSSELAVSRTEALKPAFNRVVNRFFGRAGVSDYPEWMVTDHGPEFPGRALDEWAYQYRVQLHFIEPDLGRSDPQRPAREFSKDPSRKRSGH